MPIRIYALAKELHVENKVLVDFCNRVGIAKGSALASLTDDEAAQVRTQLQQRSTSAKKKSSASEGRVTDRIVGSIQDTPLRREVPASGSSRKIPVLRVDRSHTSSADETASSVSVSEMEESLVQTPSPKLAKVPVVEVPEQSSSAVTETPPVVPVQAASVQAPEAPSPSIQDLDGAGSVDTRVEVAPATRPLNVTVDKATNVTPMESSRREKTVKDESVEKVVPEAVSHVLEVSSTDASESVVADESLLKATSPSSQPTSLLSGKSSSERSEKQTHLVRNGQKSTVKDMPSGKSFKSEEGDSSEVSSIQPSKSKAAEPSIPVKKDTEEKMPEATRPLVKRPFTPAESQGGDLRTRTPLQSIGRSERRDSERTELRTNREGPLSGALRSRGDGTGTSRGENTRSDKGGRAEGRRDNDRRRERDRREGGTNVDSSRREASSRPNARSVPVRSLLSSQLPQTPIRPDYLSHSETPTIRNIGTSQSHPSDNGHNDTDNRENSSNRRRQPVHPTLKLAPIPVAPPPRSRRSNEPAPQKPEVRLQMDMLRASKLGGNPLSEHLRKQEEKRRQELTGNRSDTTASRVSNRGGRDGLGSRESSRDGRRDTDRSDRYSQGSQSGNRPSSPVRRSPTSGTSSNYGSSNRSSSMTILDIAGGREEGRDRSESRVRDDRGNRERDRRRSRDNEELTVSGRDGRLRRRNLEDSRNFFSDDEETSRYRNPKKKKVQQLIQRRTTAIVELPCTVRSFSESLGIPVTQVLKKMLELGSIANINSDIDREMAALIGLDIGIEVSFREQISAEEQLMEDFSVADNPECMIPRPPIVTFLGHVDHGKTSLLDWLLKLHVARGEKGGITQHIRAYSIEKDHQKITFMDTPGHEAFTAMRARGANSTDIAVLVVAADDGVMPQTEEAISHAKAAGVPIIVALNKIDLPGAEANVQRIFAELSQNGLAPTEWGGDTEVVRTSAVSGQGMDDLLNTILMVAELQGLKADPTCPATGICLESEVQQGRGVMAKLLVQKGTLRTGDVLVCGESYGRIKAMYDTLNPHKKYKDAGPSMPTNITGLDLAPGAGDRFYVLEDIARARQIAEDRQALGRQRDLVGSRTHVTLENLFDRLHERTDVKTLAVILRADVRGSIEAIRKELDKLEHEEVQIQILQATVGGVTEADVHLADASDAVIIGFNVVPDERARVLAEQLGVQVRRYDIIYQVTEDLKAALEGMLKPEQRTAELGRALVQRVFHISRVGTIAGCRVLVGMVARDARARIIRDSRIVGEYPLDSLKREKDDAKEVREGYECGIRLSGYDDIKEGDLLEIYRIEEVKRTLNG